MGSILGKLRDKAFQSKRVRQPYSSMEQAGRMAQSPTPSEISFRKLGPFTIASRSDQLVSHCKKKKIRAAHGTIQKDGEVCHGACSCAETIQICCCICMHAHGWRVLEEWGSRRQQRGRGNGGLPPVCGMSGANIVRFLAAVVGCKTISVLGPVTGRGS